jgi:hypothetical protein
VKKLSLSVLVAIFFIGLQFKVQAQSAVGQSKIGFGAIFALPLGDYKETANYGTGVSFLYQQAVLEKLNFTVELGYTRFHGKEVFANIKYKEGFIPIKVGARYYLTEYVYGSGQAGISISTANGSGRGTAFAYAPGLGLTFPVAASGSLDVGLQYEGWARSSGTASFGAIRIGYNF